MIHTKWDEKRKLYYVSSDKLHKDATIKKYNYCWQIKHVSNGRTKNLSNYAECLEYLSKKGW